jgi:hypothetical protein
MDTLNSGPAESVTAARSVTPASSVSPASNGSNIATGDAPYVAPSQTVSHVEPPLPADHPQVVGASAPPPPPEAYERASSDNTKRTAIWQKEQEALRAKK